MGAIGRVGGRARRPAITAPRPEQPRTSQGVLTVRELRASSLVAGHRALGAWLAEPARRAVGLRIAAVGADELARQIGAARACRGFMIGCGRRAGTPLLLRRAIDEYFACLDAWSRAAGLAACAERVPKVAGLRVAGLQISAEDLGMWAQDDNTGCQTGMIRRADRSVMLWHTEEDTIGYIDAPRLATLCVDGVARSAFIYPYLLPGPAFGWSGEQVHAVDSLHVRDAAAPVGAYTALASWLVWRLGPELEVRAIARALVPFVDGCAIHVVRCTGRTPSAEVLELGARQVQRRVLRAQAGAIEAQANAVIDGASALARREGMRERQRRLYVRRVERARAAMAAICAQPGGASPEAVLRLLADRRGGGYANANSDVFGHCLAVVSAAGLRVQVGAGPVQVGARYDARWPAV